MKPFIFLILLGLSVPLSYSQSSPKDKIGAWYMFDGTHIVSEQISIKTDVQLRSYELLDNMNLMFYNLGINYKLSSKTTATFAYCFLDIDKSYASNGTSHLFENRFYEQICYNHNIGILPIYHRFRLENRFLNYVDKNIVKNRFRYCLGTKIKLNNCFFVNCSNEIFANLKGDVFTENRFYTAIGINLSKYNNIQLGYLNQKINGENLHRLQIGIFIKTDYRKLTKAAS